MPFFVAGVIALLVLLLAARGWLGTSARTLATGMRFSGGMLLVLLTVVLALVREFPLAFLTASGAWYVLFGSAPPWQRGYGAQPGAGGSQGNRQSGSSAPPRVASMSRAEALNVLGLQEGATEEQIRAAHRRLIQQTHPDKGGTDYLAAKINEAKDVLLRRR
jgi:hypothetical protein